MYTTGPNEIMYEFIPSKCVEWKIIHWVLLISAKFLHGKW